MHFISFQHKYAFKGTLMSQNTQSAGVDRLE